MARRKTRLIRVKDRQFTQMVRKIESRFGFSTVRSDGSYRIRVDGTIRVVGTNHFGKFINVNLLEDLGYESKNFLE